MNRLLTILKFCTVDLFLWQFSKLWRYAFCYSLFAILLLILCGTATYFPGGIGEDILSISTFLFILELLIGIAGLIYVGIFRKWLRLLGVFIVYVAISYFCIGTIFVTVMLFAFVDYDDFAVNLKLPENITLTEPISGTLLVHGATNEETFELYNGIQGGMYVMRMVCNPHQPGDVWIKARELTTDTSLSQGRLELKKLRIPGSDKDELYETKLEFTIYEGNWEEYYGANIAVWFQPASGGEPYILFEDNYKIEGWMR